MKGGSKPALYAVKAEETKPANQRRNRPTAANDTIPEPNWRLIFGKASDTSRMATDCWRKMLPILKQAGHLAAIDASVLEEWCICRARIAECERDIAKNGLTADGERGSVKNPATTIAGQYRTRLKVCEEQLGIGSMNRLRLPPPPPPKDDDSDLEGTPD